MAPSEQALPPRQRSRQPEQIRPIWTGLGTWRVHRAVLEKRMGRRRRGLRLLHGQSAAADLFFRGDLTERNKGFVVLQNVSVKQRECMLPD
ncbi:uncharacterized [Tachysurus ichikawai]